MTDNATDIPAPAPPTLPVRHASGGFGWVIALLAVIAVALIGGLAYSANHTYCAAAGGAYTTKHECEAAQLGNDLDRYAEFYRQTHDKDGYPIYGGGR